MIRVTFGDMGGALWLDMYGHANSAEYGRDLICAAATALTYTAAQLAMDLDADYGLDASPTVELMPGKATVRIQPVNMEVARAQWGVIRRGMEMLAGNYPKNIKIYYIGNGESRDNTTEDSRAEPADMEPLA